MKLQALSERRDPVLTYILPLALVYCYGPVLAFMVGQWLTDDVYSYCFLVPLISGYLVYTRREALKSLHINPSIGTGSFFVAVGMLLLVIGRAGGVLAIQELSLVFTAAGMIMFLWGRERMKELWFPLAYLVFMIPSWEIFTESLQYPFQRLSATLGVAFLWFIGIPVYQRDVFIELPNITLEVARVCSGVNYLIAVFAIGLPLTYEFLRGWRRFALLPFALFVAVMSNGVRIALIGALSYYGLNPTVHGPYHVLQGMFVSVIGYCALFAGFTVLRKGVPGRIAVLSGGEESLRQVPESGLRYSRLSLGAMIAFLVLTGSYIHFHEDGPVVLTTNLQAFSKQIGPWQVKELAFDDPFFQHVAQVYKAVGVDHDLVRSYSRGTDEVGLYIGYFESQRQAKELINYQTADLHNKVSQVSLDIGERSLEVNRAVYQQGHATRLVLFWYDIDGWVVANRFQVQIITAWRWLLFGQTSGSIILISVPIASTEEAEVAFARGADFIREVTPALGTIFRSPKTERQPKEESDVQL